MKRLGILGLLLLCAACETPAERQAVSSNNGVKVEVMTRFDGCVLYRVQTPSTVYIARCGQEQNVSANWTESCGKNCTRAVRVPTEVER